MAGVGRLLPPGTFGKQTLAGISVGSGSQGATTGHRRTVANLVLRVVAGCSLSHGQECRADQSNRYQSGFDFASGNA